MSAAEYFDLQTGQSTPRAGYIAENKLALPSKPVITPVLRDGKVPGSTNRIGRIRTVSVVLEEVMFTSRVPLSTWTFAFGVNDKLWVSDLTTLYFGKRTSFNKKIYRNKLFLPDNGMKLDVGITAYNSYGDRFNITQALRVHASNSANTAGELVKIDEDWTQLLFKFHVRIES